jgi:hypothetical protein
MKTQFVFNTVEQFQELLFREILKNKCRLVRVFEFDRSYEDYSVSFTLSKGVIFNFAIMEDESNLILQKKAKNSKCHIKFPKGTTCTMEYFNKNRPYLALSIMSKVFYTDGRSRY